MSSYPALINVRLALSCRCSLAVRLPHHHHQHPRWVVGWTTSHGPRETAGVWRRSGKRVCEDRRTRTCGSPLNSARRTCPRLKHSEQETTYRLSNRILILLIPIDALYRLYIYMRASYTSYWRVSCSRLSFASWFLLDFLSEGNRNLFTIFSLYSSSERCGEKKSRDYASGLWTTCMLDYI